MTALREKHSTAPRRQRSAMIAVTRRVFAAAPLAQRCGSADDPRWSAPALSADATTRSAQNNDTHRGHTEGATTAPRKRNDTEKNPNRQRTPQVPETTRPHNEPDRHRAPQVQQKRKETPPPQARNDDATNPERPEPTRRRASGGASSFTRFPSSASAGPSSLTRRDPDELGRGWWVVPRRGRGMQPSNDGTFFAAGAQKPASA